MATIVRQVWLYQGYLSGDLKRLVDTAANQRAEIRLVPVSAAAVVVVLTLVWWATARRPIYMVDFAVWKAPEHLKLTRERFDQGSRDCGVRACRHRTIRLTRQAPWLSVAPF